MSLVQLIPGYFRNITKIAYSKKKVHSRTKMSYVPRQWVCFVRERLKLHILDVNLQDLCEGSNESVIELRQMIATAGHDTLNRPCVLQKRSSQALCEKK
jgi:hypothetical protein